MSGYVPDEEIPGLMQYVTTKGIVDSPVNRKSYRFLYAFVDHYNTEAQRSEQNPIIMHLRMLWSRKLNKPLVFAGVYLQEGFVPVMMVMQAEILGYGDLGLQCHEDCNDYCQFIDDKKLAPIKQVATAEQKEVDERFAPIVQSWASTPNIGALMSLFYDADDEQT